MRKLPNKANDNRCGNAVPLDFVPCRFEEAATNPRFMDRVGAVTASQPLYNMCLADQPRPMIEKHRVEDVRLIQGRSDQRIAAAQHWETDRTVEKTVETICVAAWCYNRGR